MVGLKWGVKSNRWFKYESPLHASSENTGMSHNLPAWKLGGQQEPPQRTVARVKQSAPRKHRYLPLSY